MRKGLPVLLILLGFGSSFSFSQGSSYGKAPDPFERYLRVVKQGDAEPDTQRFAQGCGFDMKFARPKFAVTAGEIWTPVKDLARGLRSLESDFYTTAEVWHSQNQTLIEMWPNSDADGSEVRILGCYFGDKPMRAEVIQWSIPMDQDPKFHVWGYFRVWESADRGPLRITRAEFIDASERPITKPELDKDEEENLKWVPPLNSLKELKLPEVLFR